MAKARNAGTEASISSVVEFRSMTDLDSRGRLEAIGPGFSMCSVALCICCEASIPHVGSKPTHEQQNDEDDQDDADHTDAAVPVAITVTAKPATKAAQQEDHEDDDEYES